MLKGFLKNFLRRKDDIHQLPGLISLKDFVTTLQKSDFLNDYDALKRIEEFKKEYIKTLKLSKTIVSYDLMPRELQEFKNIYLDLLINLNIEDNTDISFELLNEHENGVDYLNIAITKIKLN